MRAGTRAAALVLAALLSSNTAIADPTGSYLYVAPYVGYTVFDGTLRVPTQTLRDQIGFGGRVGLQWKDWIGVEAAGQFTSTEEELTDGQSVTYWSATGRAVLSPYATRFGGPFVFFGGGTASLSPDIGDSQSDGVFELGGGINMWASDAIGLRLEMGDVLVSEGSKVKNHTLSVGGALVYSIGAKPRDTDGDGVPDSRDECPGTAMGAIADVHGCPQDADGDGIFDGLDDCANTPTGATVDARGCPSDQDGDGVFDGIDECADTPQGATVDAKGCPSDSDGDGVLDGIDQCANTPAGATVDERGCPTDSDNDGVFDGIDQCPGTIPGFEVNDEGCVQAVVDLETEFMSTGKFIIQNLQFASANAEVQPDAQPTLDAVGAFLFRWPGLQIEIAGYTDAAGDPGANQRLSQRRAQAVRDYLFEKYPALNPEWISVKGYGPQSPVASNETREGRAANRRVEVKAVDIGALQQELQKRLQQRQQQQQGDN